jgi:hypothetical protein
MFNTPGTNEVLRVNDGREGSSSVTPDPALDGKYSYFGT